MVDFGVDYGRNTTSLSLSLSLSLHSIYPWSI
jgi:hypothetical protein